MAASSSTEDIFVNGTIVPCKTDMDCPFTAVCYNNSRISAQIGQCGCDYEWGDIGDQCDKMSPQKYYHIVFFLLFIIISAGSMIVSLFEIWKMHKTSTGLKRLDVRTTTFIACFMFYASFLYYSASGLAIIFNPESAPDSEQNALTKKRSLSSVRSAGLAMLSFFLIASLLNVSILWLEVAIASKRFKRITGPQVSRNYRIAVAIMDLVVALLVAGVSWYNAAYTGIVGLALIVVLGFIYGYSAYSITMVMNKASSETKGNQLTSTTSAAVRNSLRRIKLCSLWVLFCLGMWALFLVIVALKRPSLRKEIVPKGQIVSLNVFSSIGFLFSLLPLWGVILYLKTSTRTKETSRAVRDLDSNDSTPKVQKEMAVIQDLSVKRDYTSNANE